MKLTSQLHCLWAASVWCLATMIGQVVVAEPPSEDLHVYIGTYTRGDSQGIYHFRMNARSGALSAASVSEATNPSFLAIHPNGKFLFAVNEVSSFEGRQSGAVSAFAIQPDGSLKLLNQSPSEGGAPCHLVVDHSGRFVLVANYSGGSVAVLPIGDDGKLGPATSFIQHEGSSVHPRRQSAPHAHSINLDAANRFAFAADLGLDKVLVYQFDAKHGRLTPHTPAAATVKPGLGPRHFAIHPRQRHAYVINEMRLTVTGFAFDARQGRLTPQQTISTLPADVEPIGSTAEVQVHPSGKFLYGSNRGHDSIAVYSIAPETGKLTHLGNQSTQGKTPRNFGIDPSGKYLLAANQSSNNVVVFRIDPRSGKLSATGTVIDVPAPVCVKFLSGA